jgi:hypothetical protein
MCFDHMIQVTRYNCSIAHPSLVSRGVDSLRDSGPFGKLYRLISFSASNLLQYVYSLRIDFRYFFSFRSKMVYLSFGTISCSTGISSFQRSTAFVTMPCLANAVSTHATTASTARRRFRCRAFWNLESRHGIFLHHNPSQQATHEASTRQRR